MALGVSRNHAHSLFSRARDQLEASVGVLVVGRSGRKDCAALDQLLHDWDGRLTAPLRRRVGRHIDRCSVCSDRRRRELRPAALLSVAPGAVVGFALAAGGVAGASVGGGGGGVGGAGLGGGGLGGGGPIVAPAGLKAKVLHLAFDHGPSAVAHRTAVAHGARAFQVNGFPQPAHTAHLGLVRIPHLPVAAVGGTAAAAATATATVVVLAVVPHAHHRGSLAGGSASMAIRGQTPPAASGTAPAGALPGRLSAIGASAGTTLTGSKGATATGRATAAGSPTSTGTGVPTGPATTGAPVPTLTATTPSPAASTPAPIVSVTVSAPVVQGSLSVSPSSLSLSALVGGSLTLTANGGPVTWSIPTPTTLLGLLSVSPSSGTLQAGQSVTVHLSVSLLSALTTTLTITPGNEIVDLLIAAL
jgi:hypothetical protein